MVTQVGRDWEATWWLVWKYFLAFILILIKKYITKKESLN